MNKKDTLKEIPGFIIPSPYFDLLIGIYGKLWVVNPGLHSFENYDLIPLIQFVLLLILIIQLQVHSTAQL